MEDGKQKLDLANIGVLCDCISGDWEFFGRGLR